MFEPLHLTVAALAISSMYSYRADFARYSIFTVGVFKRLDRTVVEAPEFECSEHHCEEQTDVAERRRYFKEIVIGGMPLLRFDGGESYYCEDHVSFEVQDELDNPKKSTTERVATSLLAALASFFEWREEQKTFDSEFSDVQSSASAAFSLIPIAMMVLLAAMIMSLMNRGAPHAE